MLIKPCVSAIDVRHVAWQGARRDCFSTVCFQQIPVTNCLTQHCWEKVLELNVTFRSEVLLQVCMNILLLEVKKKEGNIQEAVMPYRLQVARINMKVIVLMFSLYISASKYVSSHWCLAKGRWHVEFSYLCLLFSAHFFVGALHFLDLSSWGRKVLLLPFAKKEELGHRKLNLLKDGKRCTDLFSEFSPDVLIPLAPGIKEIPIHFLSASLWT